jgi:enoyl-CoA hydratase
VPFNVALEMLLTGEPLSAPRAAELGLVNRLTAEGQSLQGALELAATIAANGPLAVAATKAVARGSADWTFADGWARQAEIVAPVFGSEDAREGATAFAEKRPPVWKGR